MKSAMLRIGDGIEEGPKTLSEAIYRKLRSDIIWGKLPPGSPLRSDDLRTRYGVGISPLREALSRLASERLVTLSGQRGFRVAPIRAENIVDVTETRLVIECAALQRSIDVGDLSWETRIVAAHHALSRVPVPKIQSQDAERWTAHHKVFHMALISACGSEWQRHIADLLFDQADRFRMFPKVRTTSSRKTRDPAKEHQQIVDAALDRDAKGAILALTSHYRATMQVALEAIKNWEELNNDRSEKSGI